MRPWQISLAQVTEPFAGGQRTLWVAEADTEAGGIRAEGGTRTKALTQLVVVFEAAMKRRRRKRQ